MNKKRAIRLFGGAAGVATAAAALLAMSVTAQEPVNPAIEAPTPPEAVSEAVRASYSNEQAERGESKYEDQCEECHGDELRGGLNGGPPLRGLSFEERYFHGAPASGLFLFMSTAMPPNSPGRFSPAVYADIMAYILKRNGIQAGAELPSDVEALDNLILEK